MAAIKFEVILGILFLKINNIGILFDEKILMWKSYTISKALLTIKQILIINPKKFIIATLDVVYKIFIVYVAIQEQKKMAMDFVKKA